RRSRSGFVAAVELRLGKISTGQAEDLVRFTQLTILALQGLDAVPLLSRLTGSLAVVGLVLAHPAMQRLWDTANFGCNGLDGCPLGWVVPQVLQNRAHSTFTDFRGLDFFMPHSLKS